MVGRRESAVPEARVVLRGLVEAVESGELQAPTGVLRQLRGALVAWDLLESGN